MNKPLKPCKLFTKKGTLTMKVTRTLLIVNQYKLKPKDNRFKPRMKSQDDKGEIPEAITCVCQRTCCKKPFRVRIKHECRQWGKNVSGSCARCFHLRCKNCKRECRATNDYDDCTGSCRATDYELNEDAIERESDEETSEYVSSDLFQ